MPSKRLRVPRLALLFALIGTTTAAVSCSSSPSTATSSIKVVAAENFYGDLVKQIGGAHVEVTSVLSNPDADPHLFQPGTATGQSVAVADLVIMNGVGYDDWMKRLLDAAPNDNRKVLVVADVVHAGGDDPNPHLWYDPLAMPAVVEAIASALEDADHTNAAAYRSRARRTVKSIDTIIGAVKDLRASFAGKPVAYTERVPGLLLIDAGIRVLTPPGFYRAVEDGTDPAPADVQRMQQLLTGHQIDALLYNSQATSPITEQLQSIAEEERIPIVPVTETLPHGQTFESWQLKQIAALRAALEQSANP